MARGWGTLDAVLVGFTRPPNDPCHLREDAAHPAPSQRRDAMLQILLLHVAAAIVGPIAVARWGRRVFAILALAPASAVVWALTQTSDVLAGRSPIVSTQWVALLDLEISFRLDTLSWFMVLIVGSGIAATILRARAAPGAPAEEH